MRAIPKGRVASADALSKSLGLRTPIVQTYLSRLTEDEREIVPWHRVVASGGAIGHGPDREEQMARLLREGVIVSQAGIVQDLPRIAFKDFDRLETSTEHDRELPPPEMTVPRWRGMKPRP